MEDNEEENDSAIVDDNQKNDTSGKTNSEEIQNNEIVDSDSNVEPQGEEVEPMEDDEYGKLHIMYLYFRYW